MYQIISVHHILRKLCIVVPLDQNRIWFLLVGKEISILEGNTFLVGSLQLKVEKLKEKILKQVEDESARRIEHSSLAL